MAHTTVTVEYQSSGKPAAGRSVVLSFTSGLGSTTGAVRTGTDGRACIEHTSIGEAKVIVDGTTKCTVRCPTSVVVHV
jgi:hypothetical protein